MQTDCKQNVFEFQGLGQRKVTVDFSGGYLSSDGGGLFLREVEQRRGLIRRLADCFVDQRDARYVEHSVEELLRRRVFALSLGYEDLNDHDRLRLDPLHALLAGKADITGADRAMEREPGRQAMSPYGDWDTTYGTVMKQLATGPWLLGERHTAADVLWGSMLAFLTTFKIAPSNDTIAAYLERFNARPAVAVAKAKDDALAATLKEAA